jgi:hypothetical protein
VRISWESKALGRRSRVVARHIAAGMIGKEAFRDVSFIVFLLKELSVFGVTDPIATRKE